MVCRVGSIVRGEFDDGIIEVEAVEDIFGITKSSYEVIPDDTSPEDDLNRVVLTAEPIKTMRVMEASYHDLQTVTLPRISTALFDWLMAAQHTH